MEMENQGDEEEEGESSSEDDDDEEEEEEEKKQDVVEDVIQSDVDEDKIGKLSYPPTLLNF